MEVEMEKYWELIIFWVEGVKFLNMEKMELKV